MYNTHKPIRYLTKKQFQKTTTLHHQLTLFELCIYLPIPVWLFFGQDLNTTGFENRNPAKTLKFGIMWIYQHH